MKSIFCWLIVPLFGCVSSSIFAQGTPESEQYNFAPPSPAAASLTKAQFTGVSHLTGAVQASIPLHTFATKHLSLPINLSYSSNGVRVTEADGWAGVSWTLSVGGVINRVIRDEADKDTWVQTPDQLSMNPSDANYYKTLALVEKEVEPLSGWDSQRDKYSFNIGGVSGEFVFSGTEGFLILPFQRVKVEVTPVNGLMGGFVLTTSDGVEWTFGAVETTTVTGSKGFGTWQPPTTQATAWYLTKVEHPTGEVVHLEYANDYYSVYTDSETHYEDLNPGTCTGPDDSNPVNTITSYYASKRLTRIYSAGYGEINFTSVSGGVAASDRVTAVQIELANGTTLKKYDISYESLADRHLVTALTEKDKDNNTIRSWDMQYITSYGSTTFPNRYYASYTGSNPSYAQDHWGYFNGQSNNSNLIPTQYINGAANRNPNINYAKIGMLSKLIYPTGGYSEYTYEAHVDAVGYTSGGVRLQKEVLKDNLGEPSQTMRYYYTARLDKTGSSGSAAVVPEYETQQKICGLTYRVSHDNPVNQVVRGSYHTYYADIVVSHGGDNFENGGERFHYNIHPALPGGGVSGERILNGPASMNFWDHGLLEEQWVFNSSKKVLSHTVNEYQLLKETGTINNYVVREVVDATPNLNELSYTCKTADLGAWTQYTMGANSTQPTETTNYTDHPCYGKSVNDVVDILVHNNYASGSIDLYQYRDIAYWHELVKTTTTQYDEDGAAVPTNSNTWTPTGGNPNTTTVDYIYQHQNSYGTVNYTVEQASLHGNPVLVRTTNSEGAVQEVYTYYPEDILSGSFEATHLLANNIHNVPLRTETVVDGKVVAGSVISYFANGQPKRVYEMTSDSNPTHNGYLTASGSNGYVPYNVFRPTYFESTARRQMTYTADNNIETMTTPVGVDMAYVWDAAGKYMVAQVVNAELDEIFFESFESTTSNTTANAHTGSKGYYTDFSYATTYTIPSTFTNTLPSNTSHLRLSYWYYQGGRWLFSGELSYPSSNSFSTTNFDAIDDVRVYPVDAQMTSYTYRDGIGISSITDPSGQTVYYEYDSIGRLIGVKDYQGNLVEGYEYQYYNQN
ncbi:MAG TPA: hypothetical protein DCE41_02975 [Cytophagales bacterium]|nr:hypothetical protein [Cytophagales bacterium]HAA22563.1 hypothetical protein [Cytophagales bacterium]HAP65047.1 hypothetical protein [Cytophagales bacterium]